MSKFAPHLRQPPRHLLNSQTPTSHHPPQLIELSSWQVGTRWSPPGPQRNRGRCQDSDRTAHINKPASINPLPSRPTFEASAINHRATWSQRIEKAFSPNRSLGHTGQMFSPTGKLTRSACAPGIGNPKLRTGATTNRVDSPSTVDRRLVIQGNCYASDAGVAIVSGQIAARNWPHDPCAIPSRAIKTVRARGVARAAYE